MITNNDIIKKLNEIETLLQEQYIAKTVTVKYKSGDRAIIFVRNIAKSNYYPKTGDIFINTVDGNHVKVEHTIVENYLEVYETLFGEFDNTNYGG